MGEGWEREEATDPANLALGLRYEARPVAVQMTVDESSGKGGMAKRKEQHTH